MERILIVNQNSGYLTIDVANAFAASYDEVVVMFGYNRVTQRKFSPKIKIQKTIKYDRSSAIKRIVTWSLSTVHLFILLSIKYRKYKVLYYTNPPMSYFCARLLNNKFSIVIFDTFPDALKLIGVSDSNFIYKFWVRINRHVFKKAERIITLTEGMKKQLSKYVDSEKIKVISIWPASDEFKPLPKTDNPFLKAHCMCNKFIVMYSGNMGTGHNLEVLIEVADQLREYHDIHFLLIGEGAKKKKLKNLADNLCLNNLTFFPYQSAELLPFSLAAADVSVVAQEPNAAHLSIPSKTFNYMAVGSPLLGIGGKESELQHMIEKHNNGEYFTEDNLSEIKKYIINIYKNKTLKMKYSENSRMAIKIYSYSNAFDYIF